MDHKVYPLAEAKAEGDQGEFRALVSVFGNTDLVGDRILPGAFSKSIEKLRQSGDPLPIIWSHMHDNPMAHIGKADPEDVIETDRGLQVTGKLDIKDNELARQTFKLLKERRLREFSFGYSVPEKGQKRAKDGANEISEVELFEAGPTLKGANPETELQAVKSALKESESYTQDQARAHLNLPPHERAAVPLVKDDGPLFLEPSSVIHTDEHGNIEKIEDKTARVEDADEEPHAAKSRAQDPLRKRSEDIALEISSGGMSLRPPPEVNEEEPPPEPPSTRELRRRSHDLLMEILSG